MIGEEKTWQRYEIFGDLKKIIFSRFSPSEKILIVSLFKIQSKLSR
jgi:magnesium-transporting ATPase (P-type)